MHTRVPEAEVAEHFAELLERARAGETIVVEREGVAVCQLGPPGPNCSLDAFSRFLQVFQSRGGSREVSEAPQRLA